MGRLKSALDVKTDAALYGLLGMSSSNYANRKGAGSIPFAQVIGLSISRGVSIDWLFTGAGAAFRDGSTVVAPATIETKLFLRIVGELRRAFGISVSGEDRKSAELWSTVIALAAVIYSEVVFETGDAARVAALKTKVDGMASAARVLREVDEEVRGGERPEG